MAGLLETAQCHDLQQTADMKTGRGAVKSDIAGHHAIGAQCIEPLHVGALMHGTAGMDETQKLGLEAGHLSDAG